MYISSMKSHSNNEIECLLSGAYRQCFITFMDILKVKT